MTDPIVERLRVIERKDGGPDIVAEITERPDGVTVLRHVLDRGVLETFVRPDAVGHEVTVFYEGELQLDVGPAEILPEDDDPPGP